MRSHAHFKLNKTILACAILSCMPFVSYADTDTTTKTEAKNDVKTDTKAEAKTDDKKVETLEVVGSIAKTGTLKFYDTKSTDSISASKIEDKKTNKVDDTLSYESGVLTGLYGHSDRSNWIYIRGAKASYTLDGLRIFSTGYFGGTPETYGLEKIEVLKGVNDQYGASESGGTVNMITKRPKNSPEGELNVFYGNNSKIGVGADYSGILTDDNSVRYRVVAEARDEDGQQKYTGLEHYYFAPSLTWDINNKTTLTVLSSYQKENGIPESGFLPAYGTIIQSSSGQIDRSTFFGEPNFNHFNREVSTIGYELRHILDNGVIFTQNYKFTHQDLDITSIYAGYTVTDNKVNRYALSQIGVNNTHNIDNRFTKEFKFGKWKDTLLVGLDYLKTNMQGKDYNDYNVSSVDINDPVYGSYSVNENYQPFKLAADELGLYAQNQISYNDKLIFNQGVRHSEIKNSGYWTGSYFDRDYSHNTYNGGLMYVFDNNIAPYVNYSESFLPVYGYSSTTQTLYRPYEAKQWESGIKYEPTWMDGAFTLAYFNVTAQNSFISNGTGNASQALETRSKGAEFQMNTAITDYMNLDLAYTYTDSKTDQSTTSTIETPLTPKHSASAWVNIKFDGDFDGLTVGTGLRYVGKTHGSTGGATVTVPDFLLWDAMAKYQFNKSWSAQINATNLTDKTYVAGCSYWCYYGAERSIVATLNYKF